MRQRVILVAVALLASLITGELALNLQKPTSSAIPPGRAPIVAASGIAPATMTPVPTARAAAPTATSAQAAAPVAWIVTARQAITQGTLLRPDTIPHLFERIPLNAPAPPGSVGSLSDLRILLGPTGRVLATTLLAGDTLVLTDMGYGGTGGPSLAGQVPFGYVAVALQVAGVAGLQGVLTPGDDVDVLSAAPVSSGARSAGSNPTASVRVSRLATARVIALGPLGNEITVVVPRSDAPVLVAADELQAHLHLVLRPWSGRLPVIIPTPPPPGGPPTPTVGRSGL